MKLNKAAKIILGILTFIPILFFFGAFGIFFYQLFSIPFIENPQMPMLIPPFLEYLVPLAIWLIFLSVGLFIFYIIHIIQNKNLDSEKRILWIVILVLVYGIAIPIYWYVHVWLNHNRTSDSISKDYYEPGT